MKYTVEYWVHMAVFKTVEADSDEEAEKKMEEMIASGKVQVEKDGLVGDSGFNVIERYKC